MHTCFGHMAHKEDWNALPFGNMQQSCGALSDLQARHLSQSSSYMLLIKPPFMQSIRSLQDKTRAIGSSHCAVTISNLSSRHDLGYAASRAGDIIQIHSLDGVDDNSAGLHGNNFLQDVHEACGTVQIQVLAALQTHALCPAAYLPIHAQISDLTLIRSHSDCFQGGLTYLINRVAYCTLQLQLTSLAASTG